MAQDTQLLRIIQGEPALADLFGMESGPFPDPQGAIEALRVVGDGLAGYNFHILEFRAESGPDGQVKLTNPTWYDSTVEAGQALEIEAEMNLIAPAGTVYKLLAASELPDGVAV